MTFGAHGLISRKNRIPPAGGGDCQLALRPIGLRERCGCTRMDTDAGRWQSPKNRGPNRCPVLAGLARLFPPAFPLRPCVFAPLR